MASITVRMGGGLTVETLIEGEQRWRFEIEFVEDIE